MSTWPPVLFPLRSGDMLTIMWAGEPRNVIVDTMNGGLILRDLTDAEADELEDEMDAQMEEARP